MIAEAEAALAEVAPGSADDVRHAGRAVVRFSPGVWEKLKVIRSFLFHRMYRAPGVVEMRAKVTQVIEELFPLFMERTDLLPKQWRKDVEEAEGEVALARIVLDYIAGMTDRFAIQSHERLIGGDLARAI